MSTTSEHHHAAHVADIENSLVDPDVKPGQKRFVPLENNPEVMNSLIYKLGLSRKLAFQDVFSIDDPDLLAFVPRPAAALLLIFPVSNAYEQFRMSEDASKSEYAGCGEQEPVIWYKQTIGNACGLIGLLHGVSNGVARTHIDPNSDLHQLIKEAEPLPPAQRAELLYESKALEVAHESAAAQGDTSAPSADDKVDLHFVCFVKARDGHLWELDGRRRGPLDRGLLAAEDDVLNEEALHLGVRAFIKREEESGHGELRFSLIVLTSNME